MKGDDEIHRSFCTAYAEAVLRFVREGTNGDVVFDEATQRFHAKPIAASVPASHCDWWVGSDWPTFVGVLTCRIDPTHEQFSEKLLSNEIYFALVKSPTGKRMSRILAGLD
jgi:hypothetical protein